MAQQPQLQANVSASGGKEDGSGGGDGHNDRKGPKEGAGHILNASTTLPTKKIGAKVHAQLARKDAAFTSVVD